MSVTLHRSSSTPLLGQKFEPRNEALEKEIVRKFQSEIVEQSSIEQINIIAKKRIHEIVTLSRIRSEH